MLETHRSGRKCCRRYAIMTFYLFIISQAQAGECFPRLQRFIADGLAVDPSTIQPSLRLLNLIMRRR